MRILGISCDYHDAAAALVVDGELVAYSEEIAIKQKIVVATKLDAMDEPDQLEALSKFCADRGIEFYSISAATGQGIPELLFAVKRHLDQIKEAAKQVELEIAALAASPPIHVLPMGSPDLIRELELTKEEEEEDEDQPAGIEA